MFSNCNWLLPLILFCLGSFLLGYLFRYFLNGKFKNTIKEQEDELAELRNKVAGNAHGAVGVSADADAKMKARIAELEASLAAANSKTTDLQAKLELGTAGATVSSSESQDDLRKIEGVGPGAEKLLRGAGIGSFAALSAATPERLREILLGGGALYRNYNPTTWPEQAKLAAEGKWTELDKLQVELIGGVRISDDLKRVEGIGPRIEGLLNNNGIYTWSQLAQTSPDKLREILKVGGALYADIDPTTWPEQASLAVAGKWNELDTLQDELIGGIRISDDLRRIEGVGPTAARLLQNAGINTFEKLAATDTATLKGILEGAGSLYKNYDPGTWIDQARLASAGNWNELDKLQDELVGGVRLMSGSAATSEDDDFRKIEGVGPTAIKLLKNAGINSYAELANTDVTKLKGILSSAGTLYSNYDPTSWIEQSKLASAGKWEELDKLQDELIGGMRIPQAAAKLVDMGDDLRKIEGVGPGAERILREAGIDTYTKLAATSPEQLRKIMAEAGSLYKNYNPDSWPEQAGFAAAGDWDGLNGLQAKLIGGLYPSDDLKLIEGIGPKIEALLNADGINTYRELAGADIDRLKVILEKGGERFRLADPSTWPQQAALAADAKWDELQKLQNELDAGIRISDDLRKIEGVGPGAQRLLNNAGVYTYEQLAALSPERLREILSEGGELFRNYNPESWPEQAKLAGDGRWDDLNKLQDELIGGLRLKLASFDSENRDDLKIVEGIGPKIEELLNTAGIFTFRKLSETPVERVREILENAGPRFRIADPSTWAAQSTLAAEAKWDELTKMQEALKGGRAE